MNTPAPAPRGANHDHRDRRVNLHHLLTQVAPERRARLARIIEAIWHERDEREAWNRSKYVRPPRPPRPTRVRYTHTTPHGHVWEARMRCDTSSPNRVTQITWCKDDAHQTKTVVPGDQTGHEPDWFGADHDPDWMPSNPVSSAAHARAEALRVKRAECWNAIHPLA